MIDRYAVIGNPVAHSRSPEIHMAFAAGLSQHIEYQRVLGNLENFSANVKDFFAAGGNGLNVTVPFKEQAFALADELSERARAAQAVNTLKPLPDGRIFGDNTDGAGLVTDLGCNHRFNFSGAKILLLGAGGAARGVLRPLLDQGPAQLLIANRTASRAEQLAADFADDTRVSGTGLAALAGRRFDLIINATAAGLSGEVPAIPDDCLLDGGWIYDMMYAAEPTAFVRWGMARHAGKALDGVGMLVEQAAESFYLWRGYRPVTETVISKLKGQGQ